MRALQSHAAHVTVIPVATMRALFDAGHSLVPLGAGDDGKSPLVQFQGRSRLPFGVVISRMEAAGSAMFGIRLNGMIVADCDTRNDVTTAHIRGLVGSPSITVERCAGRTTISGYRPA